MSHVESAANDSPGGKRSTFERVLSYIEIVGNKIPDPIYMFVVLGILTIVGSAVLSAIGFSAVNPATHKAVTVYNLASAQGFVRIITTAVTNFAALPALGMVLVCMLGVGMCDKSGLFEVGLSHMVQSTKGSNLKVIAIFTFVAAMGDAAGGTGFVILPPLGALIFMVMGRNPIAGMLSAYATVSGAFAANLLVTGMDVVDVSFTQAAARLVDPNMALSPAINWYFSACSIFILTTASVLITTKVIEPRLGTYTGSFSEHGEISAITGPEKSALRWSLIAVLAYLVLVVGVTVPADSVMRDPKLGSVLSFKAPLMRSLPLLICLLFMIPGLTFGIRSGRFKNSKDVALALGQTMSDMGPYIALMFFVAQFLKYFDWSNIGIILAIKGAHALEASGLPISVVLVVFILMCACVNLLIGSASTKWAILSVVFVPMFMLLGYHPSVVQMAYRIGDAVTNPICPTFAYFAMLLSLIQKYDRSAGMGTLIANMLPYSLCFFCLMTGQFLLWFFLGIPYGPDGPLTWTLPH